MKTKITDLRTNPSRTVSLSEIRCGTWFYGTLISGGSYKTRTSGLWFRHDGGAYPFVDGNTHYNNGNFCVEEYQPVNVEIIVKESANG